MNIFIFSIIWRGRPNYSLFLRSHVRRKLGRRVLWRPKGDVDGFVDNLQCWEVGQILGGN